MKFILMWKLLRKHRLTLVILTCMLFNGPVTVIGQVQLLDIRHGEHAGYDRIVFDFSGPIYYRIINQQSSRKLYLEFHDCYSRFFDNGHVQYINDRIMRLFRVNKLAGNIISIRLEMIPAYQYRVFKMDNPWRIIIDINAKSIAARSGNQPRQKETPAASKSVNSLRYNNQENETRKLNEIIQPYEPEVHALIDSSVQQVAAEAPANLNESESVPKVPGLSLASFSENSRFFFVVLIVVAFIINCFLFVFYMAFFRKKKNKNKAIEKKIKNETTLFGEEREDLEKDFQALITQHIEADSAETAQTAEPPPAIESAATTTPEAATHPVNRAVREYSRFQINEPASTQPLLQPQKIKRRSAYVLNEQVDELLRANYDIKSIARELNLGQDEVQMIINLQKRKRTVQPEEKRNSYDGFSFAY